MTDYAIIVENVTKKYPLYHHIGSGLKNIFINPREFFLFSKVLIILQ